MVGQRRALFHRVFGRHIAGPPVLHRRRSAARQAGIAVRLVLSGKRIRGAHLLDLLKGRKMHVL